MTIIIKSETALLATTIYVKVDENSLERDLKTLEIWSDIIPKTDTNWGNYTVFICREQPPELFAILDKYKLFNKK